MPIKYYPAGFILLLVLGAAGCGNDSSPSAAKDGVKQTNFPGQVTAGGGTSGEVMARNSKLANTPDPSGTPGIPQGAGGNTGGAAMGGTSGAAGGATGSMSEGMRGQAPGGDVSGTPGIPEGSGGNTSGAEMGGTTGGAAATQAAPKPEPAPTQGAVTSSKP